MGRILPGIAKTAASSSIAIPLTPEQAFQDKLRREAAQRSAKRWEPEGIINLIGGGARALQSVTKAGTGLASAVGSIPLPQAMRQAAASRAGVAPSQELADAAEAYSGSQEVRDLKSTGEALELAAVNKDEVGGVAPYWDAVKNAEEAKIMFDGMDREIPGDVADAAGVELTPENLASGLSQGNASRLYFNLGRTESDRKGAILTMAQNAFTHEAQQQVRALASMSPVLPATVKDLFTGTDESAFMRQVIGNMPSSTQVRARAADVERGAHWEKETSRKIGAEAGKDVRSVRREGGLEDRGDLRHEIAAGRLKLDTWYKKNKTRLARSQFNLKVLGFGALNEYRNRVLSSKRRGQNMRSRTATRRGQNLELRNFKGHLRSTRSASNKGLSLLIKAQARFTALRGNDEKAIRVMESKAVKKRSAKEYPGLVRQINDAKRKLLDKGYDAKLEKISSGLTGIQDIRAAGITNSTADHLALSRNWDEDKMDAANLQLTENLTDIEDVLVNALGDNAP